MSIADDYVNALRDETKYFAAFPINSPVRLGDYGTLRGNRFHYEGNIAEEPNPFSVKIDERDGGNQYKWEFASRSTSSMKFGANVTVEAGVVSVRPGLKVEFTSDFGAYMLLGGITVKRISNFRAIAAEMKERAELDDDDKAKWKDRDWFLVNEIITSTNGIVLMSRKRGGKIIVEVKANVPTFDIANADLAFDVVVDTTATQQFIPETPGKPLSISPLFSLVYADRGMFGRQDATIRPKSDLIDLGDAPKTVVRSLTPGSLAELLTDY